MAKLSLYTFVRDGIFYDFHVVAMLKHHLPLADEIVVNEGYSSDETYEAIRDIDKKIRIFRSNWGKPSGFDWFVRFKEEARMRCTGDWCLHLDCDEFIPEWEFDSIRRFIEDGRNVIASMKILNFYGNYRVYHARPEHVGWPYLKTNLFRNLPDIEIWGDGSNVRIKGRDAPAPIEFTCHHFGFVRDPARLRQKWRNLQGPIHDRKRFTFRLPSRLFNWRPHRWDDPRFIDDLAIYDGPYIQVVREDPSEFTRDGLQLLELLRIK